MKLAKFRDVTFEAVNEIGVDEWIELNALLAMTLSSPKAIVMEKLLELCRGRDDSTTPAFAVMMFTSKQYFDKHYPNLNDDTEIDTNGLVEELRKLVDEYPVLEDAFKKFTKDL